MKVEWRPVKGYEAYYEVSEYGEFRSFPRVHETKNRYGSMFRKCGGKILRVNQVNNRYAMTEFNCNGKVKKILVHRVVYETFIGPIEKGLLRLPVCSILYFWCSPKQ